MARIIWADDWKKSLTGNDRALLRRAKEAAPERMAQMEEQLFRWTYEGRGPNQQLPDLMIFVQQGREQREEARKQREQAVSSAEPSIEIQAATVGTR